MAPRVSIVMRTKNRPLLLARAVGSVGAQSFSDYELIIVNDGGDRAPINEIVTALPADQAGRVRVVDNARPSGREAAINVGLDEIKGEFFTLLDDDDTWDPRFLETTVGFLDEHPGDAAVATRVEVVLEEITDEGAREYARGPFAAEMTSVNLLDLARQNYVPVNSLLVRAAVLSELGGYDGEFPVLADWDFNLRLVARHHVGFIEGAALAFWHQRPAAVGSDGNSVVDGAVDHHDFELQVRDRLVRAGGTDLGVLLALGDAQRSIADRFDGLAERAAESDRLADERVERVLEALRQEAAQNSAHVEAAVQGLRAELSSTLGEIKALRQQMEQRPGLAGRLARAGLRVLRAVRPIVSPNESADAGGTDARAGAAVHEARLVSPSQARETSPVPLTAAKRRLVYVLSRPEHGLNEFIVYALTRFARHATEVRVVIAGQLEAEDLERLEPMADLVELRPQETSFSEIFASEMLDESLLTGDIDELVFARDSFYGPIGDFTTLFDRMDGHALDFWSVASNSMAGHPSRLDLTTLDERLDSSLLAVRSAVFRDEGVRSAVAESPRFGDDPASTAAFEADLTSMLVERGFTFDALCRTADYPAGEPLFENAMLAIEDASPIVASRIFLDDPILLERRGILPRLVSDRMAAAGYPVELITAHLGRVIPPRQANAALARLNVLPDDAPHRGDAAELRIAATAHVFYDDMIDEILDRFATLPGEVEVFITTNTQSKKTVIERALEARAFAASEVRVVESNRGRDISAFLITLKDVLLDDRFDLVVKLHSKRSLQDSFNTASFFKDYLYRNLLGSDGYTRNVIALFQDDPRLGMVFPPTIHMNYATMGHAWFANRPNTERVAKELGIEVVFDEASPLAAFGSMFIARPRALRKIVIGGYTWEDFPDEGGYADGSLPHVLERLLAYAAIDEGFSVATVLTTDMAELVYTSLEYKHQAVSAEIPINFTEGQIAYLRGEKTGDLVRELVERRVLRNRPQLARLTLRALARGRSIAGRVRARLR